MVRGEIAAFAIVIIAILWVVAIFIIPAFSLLINALIIYVFGLRSWIEISRGSIEKFLFCGVLVFAILVALHPDGFFWPLSLLLFFTYAGVKIYESFEPYARSDKEVLVFLFQNRVQYP